MCGIVAYSGDQNAAEVLLEGLSSLEYRGYDSSGIAVLDDQIRVCKEVGKIHDLTQALKHEPLEGKLGIAHTRWATHGGVSKQNAHPHSDCGSKIFLVHNGIIENYLEIKSNLSKKGHQFSSQTDSEVIAHLIEEEYKLNPKLKLEDALLKVLKLIKGTYGLAVISTYDPGKIVAARNFSPLRLGVGQNELILASDPSAIIKITRDIIYLEDGEMAIIENNNYRIIDLENHLISRLPHLIDWDIEQAQKGGYEHFMLKEIHEQGESLRNSTRGRVLTEEGLAVLGGLSSVKKKLDQAGRLVITGCGTAALAGKVGEYMLEEYAGIPVEVDLASELRYRKPVFGESDVLLAVSQSGETADTLAAIQEAKRKGILTLGIVNAVGSTIARETDAGVYQHIGPEIGVASTKAFTSQLIILALLTLYFGRSRNMSLTMGRKIAQEILKIPDLVDEVLQTKSEIEKIAQKYKNYDSFFYLGRKYNNPVAQEGALKLKEISYIHAEGYPAGELKHGPLALIDENFPSLVLAPSDSVYEKMISNVQEIKARKGKVVAVATQGNEDIENLVEDVIYIPKTLEMLTPILSVIPLQIFAYYVATARGCNVDMPRNLAKSVTVE